MLLPPLHGADRTRAASTRRSAVQRLAFLGAVAGLLGLVLLVAHVAGIPPGELTPDPNSVAEQAPYVGIISTLGVMAWGAIVAFCLLAGAVLYSVGGRSQRCRFMLATAAFALIVGVDDAAMFHENVAPDNLGVPQRAVIVLMGLLALAWIVASWDELRRSDSVLLVATGICFGLSVMVDQLYEQRVVEDFFKYVGIASLTAWALLEARASLVASASQA